MLVTVAFHQSSGFCSAQPGLGTAIGYSVVASSANAAVGCHQDRLAPRRPNVDSEKQGHLLLHWRLWLKALRMRRADRTRYASSQPRALSG